MGPRIKAQVERRADKALLPITPVYFLASGE